MIRFASTFLPPVGFLLASLIGTTAGAANLTINSLDDSDLTGDYKCTLREAINNANANTDTTAGDCAVSSGADTITFSVSGIIPLVSTLPDITDAAGLIIDGGNAITVSGNHAVRVMFVDAGATLSLQNLTVANGRAADYYPGGGIYNKGTLVVTNSTISDNVAVQGPGGGIGNEGTLTVTDSTFSNNFNEFLPGGGGIFNNNTLTVTGSTFTGNRAERGGGIAQDIIGNGNRGTRGTVTNSTFSNNFASLGGGGISGVLTITNSTFSGNPQTLMGGGGGIVNSGSLNLANTIVANSGYGGDCIGTVNPSGINLVEDGSCGASSDPVHFIIAPPSLGPLAYNGGPTQTHALLAGSPAIDAADNSICSDSPVNNIDQRGVARPQDGNGDGFAVCDIGSFEFGNGALDNFNRPDGPVGPNWSGATGKKQYAIENGQVEPDGTLPIYWNKASFGVNQEAFVTLKTVDKVGVEQDLLLKVQKGPNASVPNYNKGVIEVDYLAQTKAVRVATLLPKGPWMNYYLPTSVKFKDADKLGARIYGDGSKAGTVYIYRNGTEVGKVTLNAADQAFFNTKGGYIGLWFINSPNGYFDDFGGGNL